jgi:hypothetical protein
MDEYDAWGLLTKALLVVLLALLVYLAVRAPAARRGPGRRARSRG